MKVGRVTEGHLIEIVDQANQRTWSFEVPKDGPRARTISRSAYAPWDTATEAGSDAAMEVARREAVDRMLIDL